MYKLDSNRIIFTVIVLATLIVIMFIIYGTILTSRFVAIESRWSEFSYQTNQKTIIINQIRHHLGYAGFIHNFKNYLLRRDENLLPVIEKNLHDFYQALADYQALPVSDSERNAIQRLDQALHTYHLKFELAQKLIRDGLPVVEMDARVKMKDDEALEAINHLESLTIQRTQQVDQETEAAMHSVKRFALWGYLLIPIIVLSSLVIIFMLRRLSVTSRKLKHTILELDTLLELSPDATLSIAADGTILRANQQATQLFGYKKDELLALKVESLIPEQYRDGHLNHRKNFLLNPSMRSMKLGADLFALTKEGKSIPVEISLSYLQHGEEIITQVTLRDMCAHREAEEILRRERDFSNSLIETAQAIILVLDPQGKIVEFNPFFEKISGYTLNEVKGRDWFSTFLPEKEHEDIKALFLKAIDNIQTIGNINSIITKEGKERAIEWYDTTLRDANGIVLGLLATGQDVTDKLEAQQKLEQSEAHFRTLVDNIPGVVYRCALDLDWTVYFISDQIEDLSGYPASDFLTGVRHYASIIHPDDVTMVEDSVMNAVKQKKSFEIEYRIIAANKDIHWVFEKGQAVFNDEGEVLWLDGAIFDCTASKETEQNLHLAQERLNFLVSSTTAVIFTCEAYGDYAATYITENVFDQLGYTAEEFLTTPDFWANHIHPDDKPRIFEELPQLFKRGYHEHEYRFQHKDGRYRWKHDELKLVTSSQSEPQEIVGFFVDVHERKQMETALSQSRATVRALLDSTHDQIYLIDRHGKLLEANEAGLHALGKKHMDELLNHNIYDYLSPAITEQCQRINEQGVSSGKTVSFQDKRGNTWFDNSIYPISDHHGAITKLAIYSRDISDLRLAERKRLNQARQQRDTLVREVHHRIKNNLQSVSGLLRRHLRSNNELNPVLEAAINQVNSVAIIHGLQGTQKHRLNLCDVVKQIVTTAMQLTQTNITVSVDAELDIPLVMAEEEAVAVALILNELITNAIKHGVHHGGHDVHVFIQRQGDTGQVQITNYGSLLNTFDFDNETGFGMGLKLVKSLLPDGVSLSIQNDDEFVVSAIVLKPPVIIEYHH